MRAVIICLGVLSAASLQGGAATAQFVPSSSFLGDFGQSGFVPTNAFPIPANGFGFQGNAGNGGPEGLMGDEGWGEQDPPFVPQIRRQFRNNPSGLPTGRAPIPFAPTPPMQQTPYPQQFPYTQQLQNMRRPQYGSQPQYVAQPQMAPHLHFGQQPQYMLTFPMLQPSR